MLQNLIHGNEASCSSSHDILAKVKVESGKSSSFERNEGCGKSKGAEAISHFSVSDDTLPSTFQLLKVQDLPTWANTSAVALDDIIEVFFSSSIVCDLLFLLVVEIKNIVVTQFLKLSWQDEISIFMLTDCSSGGVIRIRQEYIKFNKSSITFMVQGCVKTIC